MYRGAGINMTIYSIDWEHPRVDRTWNFPGDEIRVYVYSTQTGANMGYVRYLSGTWQYVKQVMGKLNIPYAGWTGSKLKYNGTWELEMYGPDDEGWLRGGSYYYDGSSFGISHVQWGLDSTSKWGAQTGIWLEFNFNKYGFLGNPGRYRTSALLTKVGLETGTYELKAYTLGYVQKKPITVYAQKGQQADTKINLVIGVNMTANIKFKKEGILTHVPYNSSARIRVFNENDQLVATWFSSLFDRATFYKGVVHKGSTAYGGYGIGPNAISGSKDPTSPDFVEAAQWVRDSTTDLQVLMVGNYLYQENDQYCTTPSDYRWNKFYGIDGWPNYEGTWRIEVDLVNLYQSTKSFPAPPGLLLGESYHIINGVEGPYGGMWKRNHLGPWEQRTVVTVPNAHLGGEASVIFELDQRGLVSGQIAGFTWSDELRPTSWASITASGSAGMFTGCSADGYYDMYLQAGSYELTVVESPGHVSKSAPVTVSTGQQVTGFSFYLERTNVPIPEFGAVMALVSGLSASLYVLGKTNKKG
jgi:hypothetical protein